MEVSLIGCTVYDNVPIYCGNYYENTRILDIKNCIFKATDTTLFDG